MFISESCSQLATSFQVLPPRLPMTMMPLISGFPKMCFILSFRIILQHAPMDYVHGVLVHWFLFFSDYWLLTFLTGSWLYARLSVIQLPFNINNGSTRSTFKGLSVIEILSDSFKIFTMF